MRGKERAAREAAMAVRVYGAEEEVQRVRANPERSVSQPATAAARRLSASTEALSDDRFLPTCSNT